MAAVVAERRHTPVAGPTAGGPVARRGWAATRCAGHIASAPWSSSPASPCCGPCGGRWRRVRRRLKRRRDGARSWSSDRRQRASTPAWRPPWRWREAAGRPTALAALVIPRGGSRRGPAPAAGWRASGRSALGMGPAWSGVAGVAATRRPAGGGWSGSHPELARDHGHARGRVERLMTVLRCPEAAYAPAVDSPRGGA